MNSFGERGVGGAPAAAVAKHSWSREALSRSWACSCSRAGQGLGPGGLSLELRVLGLRYWDSGFGVWDSVLGFRVWGMLLSEGRLCRLVLRAWGFGLRAWGVGFEVQGVRFGVWGLGFGFRVWGAAFRV